MKQSRKSTISEVQTDSAIGFEWKKPQKIEGKVFARKRKLDSNKLKQSTKTNESTGTAQPFTFKLADISNKTKGDKNIDTDATASGLIKRKKKKDKRLTSTIDAANDTSDKVHKPQAHSLFSEKYKSLYVKTHSGKSVSESVFGASKFSDLSIHRHVVSNLEKLNFVTLTNVQEKSIPVIITGKNTLIRSQTGSGKTLAYAVPIIDALQSITPHLKRSDGVQAIIVVPTRELALQTHEWFGKINTFQRVVVGHLCGGENRKTEKDRLRKGVNVLIGTPGRLLDHILHTSALKICKVRCLVLDEADLLLDMGFKRDIEKLVEALNQAKKNMQYDPMALLKGSQNTSESEPEKISDPNEFPLKNINSDKLQVILLSATLTPAVSELADFVMKDHEYVDALENNSNVIANSLIIPSSVKQEVIITYVKHRLFTLAALIVAKSKQNSKLFIFMASKQMVEFHYNLFTKYLARLPKNRGKTKIGNVVLFDENESENEEEEDEEVLDTEFFMLHGSMDQKIRKEVFSAFRNAKKGVLICTDVAARGLDVPTADCIVQYTGPLSDEDYLHRVGRTGRAGKAGSALIFLTHEEQEYITRLQEHRVFLKNKDPQEFLKHLCDLMEEPDQERAATALQAHFESAVKKDKELYREACFAYSTWSRFYNSYPTKMRTIFNFKKLNLGHYVTSFAIRETPSMVSRVVSNRVDSMETPKLNKKLEIHELNKEGAVRTKDQKRRKSKSATLVMSEYASGLEPVKKKMKKTLNE